MIEQARAAVIASADKDRIVAAIESAVLAALLPYLPAPTRPAVEVAVRAAVARAAAVLDEPVQVEAGAIVVTDHR